MKQDFQTFFQTNEGRIHYQIQRLGITGDLYEDFYSEGMIALWKAYKRVKSTILCKIKYNVLTSNSGI